MFICLFTYLFIQREKSIEESKIKTKQHETNSKYNNDEDVNVKEFELKNKDACKLKEINVNQRKLTLYAFYV